MEKTALVTGASSGIGAAVSRRLAAGDWNVLAAGRDAARVGTLGAESPRIDGWVGDITAPAACADLVAACIERFGRLDLLVNNAGIYAVANAEQTTDEMWRDVMAINLDAPFYLSRAALPHLRETRGSIVNVASNWGLVGGGNAVAYCASKGGVVLMTRAMARDHAAEGIRVNAVCPGDVETPMLYDAGARRGLDPATTLREADRASPTGRVTTPDEVAALVMFLASDAAAQISGAAIPIDGADIA